MHFFSYQLVRSGDFERRVVDQFGGLHWTVIPIFAPSTAVGTKLGDRQYMRAVDLRSRDKPQIDIWYPDPGDKGSYEDLLIAVDSALSEGSRRQVRDGRLLAISPRAAHLGYVADLPEDDPACVKRELLALLDLLRSPDPIEALRAYAELRNRSLVLIEPREKIDIILTAIGTIAGIANLIV